MSPPGIRNSVILGVLLYLIAAAAFFGGVELADGKPHHHKPKCFGHRATIVGKNADSWAPGGGIMPGVGHVGHSRRPIIGTKRRDVIVGKRAAEWIVGNGGSDIICGRGGSDMIFLGAGDRPVEGRGRADGGPGPDYIHGTYRGDLIRAGGGTDLVDGEFGSDRIEGGNGSDFVRSQVGDDHIILGRGANHVESSSGADYVVGGPGPDNISTGSGRDRVDTGAGDDSIHLLAGNDRAFAGVGDDFVGGGDGNDVLQGGLGDDTCSGGHGFDTFIGCEGQREFEGPPPPKPPKIRLRTLPSTSSSVHNLRVFRRHLRHTEAVHKNRRMGWLLARYRQLAHAASGFVEQRDAERLERGVPEKRRALEHSVEYLEVRQLRIECVDELDRLRVAWAREQSWGSR
jgi:Ca2+-binding RTX toxin-like protein